MLTEDPVKSHCSAWRCSVVHCFGYQDVIDVQSLSYHLLVELGGNLVSSLGIPVEADQLVVDPHLLISLLADDHRVRQQTASFLDCQLGILEDSQRIAVCVIELPDGLTGRDLARCPGFSTGYASDIDSPNRPLEVVVGDDQLFVELEHVGDHVGSRLLDGIALVGHVGDIGHEGHLECIPSAHIGAGGIHLEFSLGRDRSGSPFTGLVGEVVLHSPFGIETSNLVHRYHWEPLVGHKVRGLLPVGERPLRLQPGHVDLRIVQALVNHLLGQGCDSFFVIHEYHLKCSPGT